MGEKFIKHFAIIGSGTLISMMIGFFTTPIITRIVSPNSYGQVSIFILYTDISVLLLYFGLDQAMVRYFYDCDTVAFRRKLLFRCVTIPFSMTLIAAAVVLLMQNAGLISFELGSDLLPALCIYVLLNVVYRFAQLLVRLQYKTKKYSALNVLQKTLYVCTSLLLINARLVKDTTSLIIGNIFAIGICTIIAIVTEKELWDFRKIQSNDKCISSRELLNYSYPYIFTMGISTLFQTIDKISLNSYCTYEEVGIYTSAMTLIHIFAIIQTSFNTLWTPMAVEKYSKDPNDRSFYQKGNSAITVIMFLLGICLIFVKDVFALILGKSYREAAYLIPFLIFNPLMFTISETTVTGLVLKKRSKSQVFVMIVPCIVNVIGNCILVPMLRSRGAAISTGISYIILFAMRTYMSNKFFYVDYNLNKVYILTAVTVAFAFISTFVEFGLLTIVGFVVCLSTLLLLYHDEVLYLFLYGINIIEEIMNKKTNL